MVETVETTDLGTETYPVLEKERGLSLSLGLTKTITGSGDAFSYSG